MNNILWAGCIFSKKGMSTKPNHNAKLRLSKFMMHRYDDNLFIFLQYHHSKNEFNLVVETIFFANNSYWSKNMLSDTLQNFFSTYFAVEKNSLFCRTKIYFVEEIFICVQRSKHYWIRRQSQHAVRTLIIQGKEINCETKRKILPYK